MLYIKDYFEPLALPRGILEVNSDRPFSYIGIVNNPIESQGTFREMVPVFLGTPHTLQ